ncbi:MAG: hypothetical protein Q4B95_08965 [Lonepinella koalarum]|nr:hypothetical protein [Lonepinella koalarum]
MIDLSNIQENINSKYISLEHLRAFIYKSKINKGTLKGKNEAAFYGVTCAKDAFLLINEAKQNGYNIEYYKQNTIDKVPFKTSYDDLKSYFEYLLFLDNEHNYRNFFITPSAYEAACEQKSYDYLNIEYLFIREQIEELINAKIPYINELSEIENVELIPIHKNIDNKEINQKSETSYLNIIQALKDELLATGNHKNQSELIEFLSGKYQGYTGLTESNLRDKFAKANQIK